jgi:hypothetical protein
VSDESSRTRLFTAKQAPKTTATHVTELRDMLVTYAKQETVDPLRSLGNLLGFGVAGALVIGTGWIFALLALLRALQQITFFNDPSQPEGGTWSWLPYVVTLLAGIAVIAAYGVLAGRRFNAEGRHPVHAGDQGGPR